MILFWVLAALMTLVALAFVLVPLLRSSVAAGPSAHEVNLAVLRGQRREIDDDIARGSLPADAREEALRDLIDRAQGDLPAIPARTEGARKKPWPAALAIGVALPAIAFATYLALGTPAATDPRVVARPNPNPSAEQIVAMVEALALKVRERPDDARGWALLARSMAALGRFKESAEAYERLVAIVPKDAQVLADYADALGMAQGRSLAGRPYALAREALAIDPRHRKALALAGTAAMDGGDFPAAARYWQALASDLPPGSEDEAQIRAILEELRLKATAAGAPLTPAAKPALATRPAAPPPQSVTGSVSIAPAVATRVNAADTVFIFARAEGAGRMPLAILRTTAREWPIAFSLDDTMAMSPSSRLSLADAVRIEARVSRSGNAMPQPGDLVGASAVVKPGAREVKIVVDKVLP